MFDLAAEVDGLAAAAGVFDLAGPAVVVGLVEPVDHSGYGVAVGKVGQDGFRPIQMLVWMAPGLADVLADVWPGGGRYGYAPWLSMPVPWQSAQVWSSVMPVPLQVQQR
ncbi:hypothetical protein GCM10009733_032790 [Nonomuraea maheshkhaliensis]|uniref:Uncharacterized protein n=1 Tax=Nonomuraea maheshkhaliensis TaxID=419590 RepID=A0ABN2F6R4_9ACTN